MLISGGGVLWLSSVGTDTTCLSHLMPAIFAVAVGFGLSFVPMTLTAVNRVRPEESGIASALLNAAQQIGTALGLAVVASISVTVTEKRLPDALTTLYQARSSGDCFELILAGFMTHMCISATARAAVDLGYRNTVVAAATATRDLPNPAGGIVPAAEVQRSELAALADSVAVVVKDAAVSESSAVAQLIARRIASS